MGTHPIAREKTNETPSHSLQRSGNEGESAPERSTTPIMKSEFSLSHKIRERAVCISIRMNIPPLFYLCHLWPDQPHWHNNCTWIGRSATSHTTRERERERETARIKQQEELLRDTYRCSAAAAAQSAGHMESADRTSSLSAASSSFRVRDRGTHTTYIFCRRRSRGGMNRPEEASNTCVCGEARRAASFGPSGN